MLSNSKSRISRHRHCVVSCHKYSREGVHLSIPSIANATHPQHISSSSSWIPHYSLLHSFLPPPSLFSPRRSSAALPPPQPPSQPLHPRPKPLHNIPNMPDLIKLHLQLINLSQNLPKPSNLLIRPGNRIRHAPCLPFRTPRRLLRQIIHSLLNPCHNILKMGAQH